MPKKHDVVFQSCRAISADNTNGSNLYRRSEAAIRPGPQIRNDLVPELNLTQVDVADLKSAQQQVRKSTQKQIAKVRRSIAAFGFVTPVLISGKNEIVGGHTRVEAARELGLTSIPCIQVGHLSELEVRTLRLALNKTQETGAWDEDILKLEFEYLLEYETDLEITGFEPPEIDNILEIGGPSDDDLDPLDDIGRLPDANADATTQPGDLWVLGEHRILCGNARSPSPDYSPDVLEQRFLCAETVSHLPRQTGLLRGLSGACV